MTFRAFLTSVFVRPYIRAELPGWGALYVRLVGDYRKNAAWRQARPTVIRDKVNGLFHVLDLREWPDRMFFFLGRWYDLECLLTLRALVRPGDTVLDVGANYGHFSLAAAALAGPGGKVLSFEPNPASFARLGVHVALNRLAQVEPRQMGMADVPGELVLSVPAGNSGEATFAAPADATARSVVCPVGTIDALGLSAPVRLIKIDTEGFEHHVLTGGAGVVARDRPFIITEVVDDMLQRAGQSKAALLDLLSRHGYTPWHMGLKRAGGKHVLALTPAMTPGQSFLPDGDYLWVPADKAHELGL
ncbi:MAG: FkbM family methyltransferase [Pararhodobacter sp.]|nr:FkbM family methyltransferase [Pararhodobacter sp.]